MTNRFLAWVIVGSFSTACAVSSESEPPIETEPSELAALGTNYASDYGNLIASKADCDAIRRGTATLTAAQTTALDNGCCATSNRRRGFDPDSFSIACKQASFRVSCESNDCPTEAPEIDDEAPVAD